MQVRGLHHDGESGKPDTGTANADTRFSGGEPGAPMASDADTAARDGRFELRESLRAVTGLERLAKCGLSVLAGGVVPVIRNGRAGFAGVVTCGSVHVCPCCQTSIRRVRQDELDQVGQFWECQSCGLVMMTLTMRHYDHQHLEVLAGQQSGAWKLAFGQNAGRTWRDAKRTYGVRGYVRAWEVTHGENGWHVHYHVLLFLARPLTRPQVAALQHTAFNAWSAALARVDAYLPVEFDQDGNPVGVRIDAPDRGEAGTLARYLMKGQDGKASWGVAAEMTRQDVKAGQGGHRTPIEIARAATLPDADPRDVALWREFEVVASGIRSLYWSNGLRKLLAEMGFELDTRDDGKVAAEEAAAGDRIAMIPAATWYRHIARHKGRALAILKAAEAGGVRAVRALVESWSLVWGADVFDAEHLEPAAATLTAAEVLRRMTRAEMAARVEVWRRGFDQADVAERKTKLAQAADDPETTARLEKAKRARAEAAEAAEQVAEERRRTNTPVPMWWSEYTSPEALDDLRRTALWPQPNNAQAEFLRRRRTVQADRADAVAAGLERARARG